MKYKCIAKYFVDGSVIMRPGDIIAMQENQLYNVTTGIDYNIVHPEEVKSCLEAITDEPFLPKTVPVYRKVESPADSFKNITKEMTDTFERKNHDYGNSFELSLDEEGLAAARIRMGDKWNRFKQLSKGEKGRVNDESIRDTLLDMANYAIMTIMWLDKNEGKKST